MIQLVIDQRRRDLGGFEVGRVLPSGLRRMVGPFIFFDHMGPVDFPRGVSRSVDVRPHPHIGLSTVTYLFDGEIMHRDSIGSEQPIVKGDVNWMIAGRGITHSERFERARAIGGHMHGIQSWVALPTEVEEMEPAFAHHAAKALPEYKTDTLRARLVAGAAYGATSPVQTFSPMFYVHWELVAGATAEIEARYPERAAYVVTGTIEIDHQRFDAGKMIVLDPGQAIAATAVTDATVVLVGGEPIGPRYIEWNFVSSSRDRIEQAKADWRAQRMRLPIHDDQEYIPLTEPPPPANPMS
jgi:redox-sensitive bicupin YhaK (pirin superfamily)